MRASRFCEDDRQTNRQRDRKRGEGGRLVIHLSFGSLWWFDLAITMESMEHAPLINYLPFKLNMFTFHGYLRITRHTYIEIMSTREWCLGAYFQQFNRRFWVGYLGMEERGGFFITSDQLISTVHHEWYRQFTLVTANAKFKLRNSWIFGCLFDI